MTVVDGMSIERPNIILLVTDQERTAPPYETPEMVQWRKECLPARERLSKEGFVFPRHYTSTTACVPSRTSLYTGLFPSQHGVTSTWGGPSKNVCDAGTELRPWTVPTMGDYFSAAGYDTKYIGKWHISNEDLMTSEGDFVTDPNLYKAADPLKKFGFSGWCGPEPHGAMRENSGLVRDPPYSAEAIQWLEDRPASANPFLLVVNFVNPHDIVACPSLQGQWGLNSLAELTQVPHVPPAPFDDLTTKPSAHAGYKSRYNKMFGTPAKRQEQLVRRIYYALHALVDKELDKVLAALDRSPHRDTTIVMRTADHGELLGSHGGLWQKWYTAYEEAVRVPWVVSGRPLFPNGPPTWNVEGPLSNSVDILPTLLGLAGVSPSTAGSLLADGPHNAVLPLAGQDWSLWLRALGTAGEGVQPPPRSAPLYMEFLDNISVCPGQLSGQGKIFRALGLPPAIFKLFRFDSVGGPNFIQAVVARGPNGGLWKLVRYWDNPAAWTSPGIAHVDEVFEGTRPLQSRTSALPDQWELYDLVDDPAEIHNLMSCSGEPLSSAVTEVLAHLRAELGEAKERFDGGRVDARESPPGAPAPIVAPENAHELHLIHGIGKGKVRLYALVRVLSCFKVTLGCALGFVLARLLIRRRVLLRIRRALVHSLFGSKQSQQKSLS